MTDGLVEMFYLWDVFFFFSIVGDHFTEKKRRRSWVLLFVAAAWRAVSLLYGGRHWHSWHRQTDRQMRSRHWGILSCRWHSVNKYLFSPPYYSIFCVNNLPSLFAAARRPAVKRRLCPAAARYAWANDAQKSSENWILMEQACCHCERGYLLRRSRAAVH